MHESDSDGPLETEATSRNNLEVICLTTSADNAPLVSEKHDCKSDLGEKSSNLSEEEGSSLVSTTVRTKRKMQVFSDSDGESKDSIIDKVGTNQSEPNKNDSEPETDDSDNDKPRNTTPKSRLRNMSSSGDESHSETNNDDNKSSSNDEQESRIKNKRNKLRQKFQNLVSKKNKKAILENKFEENNRQEEHNGIESQSSDDEASSIEKLKQQIRERTEHLKSSIYDPDTSDEEETIINKKNYTQKKERKSTKPTPPKPLRMSAKQAMENMQKIKSESNRMLREKEVSLPYHRPKALSLKDIMNRRRTALTVDGKALPIKMNEEQLKQYSQLLEQRQKEVIELCKSDTEEEEVENINNPTEGQTENTEKKSGNPEKQSENKENRQELALQNLTQGQTENTEKHRENPEKQSENKENQQELALQNDTLFDDLTSTETQTNNSTEQENFENIITNETVNIEDAGKNVNDAVEIPSYDLDQTDLSKKDDKSRANDDESVFMDVDSETIISKRVENTVEENNSMEKELIYNHSIEETTDAENNSKNNSEEVTDKNTKSVNELDSQLISLHYDTERTEHNSEEIDQIENDDKAKVVESHNDKSNIEDAKINTEEIAETHVEKENNEERKNITEEIQNDFFYDGDDDMNVEDIDALIERAEITASHNKTDLNSPMLIKEPISLSGTPKLTGAPGMVIDLDGTDPLVSRKLTGVELLKERFVYFSKLKTPEELEREKERRIKPGMQHLKLKMELEEQIAEQRSLEWAKRLEESKAYNREGSAAEEEDIDDIEAKLEEKEETVEKENSSESEEDEEELEPELVDKPRKRNPMVDDEAEESDCDEVDDGNKGNDENEDENEGEEVNNADDEADENEEESSDESEESEDEQQSKPKKGRILKAFEDSDDEDTPKAVEKEESDIGIKTSAEHVKLVDSSATTESVKTTQDDVLNLAQKSMSEDLFTSQESRVSCSGKAKITDPVNKSFDEKELGTQTFSILETTSKENPNMDLSIPDTLSIQRDTQFFDDNLDSVVRMGSGSFSQIQNLIPISQTSAEVPESQAIGDDVLALCTGQFYDNQFVSQIENENIGTFDDTMNDLETTPKLVECKEKNVELPNESEVVVHDETGTKEPVNIADDSGIKTNDSNTNTLKKTAEDPNLKSILDELNDPEFDTPKTNKFFVDDNLDKENKQSFANVQSKKKFVIDSDEEGMEEGISSNKKKKIKRKKLEQRALHISDDEEDENENEEDDEYESELEDEDGERLVEYDSEENEVIVEPQNPKKKRKLGEFFEREAELTSEDEWMGSGDEDEAGLDRMEREEGDDETFDQKQLQRELGQIHMRDVLDQDKREVRLIQELLFEDGDLGSGSRQRKFRWRDADGEDETGAPYDEFADTQEEEFESEEQWRKQRHEREMFLKTLNAQENTQESLNISVNRTSMIKANLSKNTSNLFVDINTSIEEIESPVPEKKTATVKDIPSPKKPFTIFKQNYPGSLLSRTRGALARLAALATPLADEGAPRPGSIAPNSKRNFVFATIDAPDAQDDQPKVTKRKAESNAGTPRLVKKMRAEEKQKPLKSSLLDQLKV